MIPKKGLLNSLILVTLLWSFSGCEQIDKLTQFTMDYDETIVIPSTIGINLPFNVWTPSIKTNSEEVFEFNDTRKDLVEELTLSQLTLNIVDPAEADFSFLESIEIYISAEGQDEILVAWKYDIDDNIGNSLSLETSDEDLSAYILEDEFSLKFTTVTDKLILFDHEVEVNSSFFVDASILGI